MSSFIIALSVYTASSFAADSVESAVGASPWTPEIYAADAAGLDAVADAEGSGGTEATPDTFSGRYVSDSGTFDGVRHGVRLGYVYAANGSKTVLLENDHLFAMGYEAEFRINGSESVDFVIVTNILALGMNQGVFIPSVNVITGLSLGGMVEVGAGANITPAESGSPLHMILAAAITPSVGELQLPLALSYVPDNDGNFRIGLTTGVNWAK